ncbi:MAG: bifunctional 3,4-dihydroxy-2-butanone-4-phosphate synthase/GTP cyclohydrolase II [Pseudomonadota bacterium]|nr:bifunctional 3,4-dihydroxy-2-butanone-4-phosphate synthase/GTP cyclohydrolase II [Pseudomonadota bacterium]HJO35430.1 bifunctional 3,4-dihydroxy-2-butanone-4-phosphate synthase/GTP cyclohydrolase II [Gammaproteobacteria bacterium]
MSTECGEGLDPIEDIIDDIRRGRMVVVMDDEDRENEGDLVMAAVHTQAEDINFMARYGRGLICLTLTPQRCRQLRLPLMVSDTDEKHTTNFTVSIEAATGVTTGISAADRARTVQAAVRASAVPEDLVSPGHIFPLMAQSGGVLARAGHTEAGCDLARLAGLEPAAVIVEILNEDGTMARRPELEQFAREHGLKIGTVADLIRYRLAHETTVARGPQAPVHTPHGPFQLIAFEDLLHRTVHLALVYGTIDGNRPVPVRVHVQHTLADLLTVEEARAGWPLDAAMARIAREGSGVLLILRQPEPAHALFEQIRALEAGQGGVAGGQASGVLRTYGTGAQILKSLGVRQMRVLSAPRRLQGLSGFGLEIVDYIDD